MNTSLRVAFLLLCSFLMPSTIASAQPAVDAEAKPFIGTWSGKENRQLGLPAPKLKIRKDGKGAIGGVAVRTMRFARHSVGSGGAVRHHDSAGCDVP